MEVQRVVKLIVASSPHLRLRSLIDKLDDMDACTMTRSVFVCDFLTCHGVVASDIAVIWARVPVRKCRVPEMW